MKPTTTELHRLARIGAIAEIARIQATLRTIYRAFPELDPTARTEPVQQEPAAVAPQPKRHTMSAAARTQVSRRMKRYWAERRAVSRK